MDSSTLFVSTGTLNRIFIALLYILVALISLRTLAPRLPPVFRGLSGLMLAAQALVFLWALEWQPSSNFEHWLRVFTEEFNVPAMLASIQLALIAAVSLTAAWLAVERPAWFRLYFVFVGLLFLYFATDEYFALHERLPNWERYYAVIGALVVLATLAIAKRSPRQSRMWHACLIIGLFVSAAGGIGLELTPRACDSLGFLRFDGCLLFFYMEESLELVGTWLVLVAMLGHLSNLESAPRARVWRFLYALPALWVFIIFLITLVPRLELRFIAQPAAVTFDSGVRLHGYLINGTVVQLYSSASFEQYRELGYSIHLVDRVSGESIANRDRWASRQEIFWLFGPDYAPLYRQWMAVDLPPAPPTNRALLVVLTLWRERDGEYARQPIVESDLTLLAGNQIVLGELVLPAAPTASAANPMALFSNGFALNAANLPQSAQPGAMLAATFTWHSESNSDDDFVQFLHLGHAESGEWWVYDQQPLGARLPSRLWYAGLVDSETWAVPLPADLAPGTYEVFTGLYRMIDKERVPARDRQGKTFLDARVALGKLLVRE